ncbi:protein PTST, chloroplastic [Sesamum alatum]|uniref:Protein PTST, chloroplastic n=1 Tax=Sesamum alatum TaxID=300844 RepID=A0AAE1YAR3_9LAMI|nr:protein PTST, chloroplastic [Sesamum alatum]
MECKMVSSAVQTCFARMDMKRIDRFRVKIADFSGKRLNKLNRVLMENPVNYERWRVFCNPVSLEEEFSAIQSKNFAKEEESAYEITAEEDVERPPSKEELKALLADSQRSKLIKKLSEANQQNRLLKRQLQVKEDALVSFKSELAIIDQEIKALVRLAEEIASYGIPDGSRKINGKYIQSHLLTRLEAVLEKCAQQIKDVNAAQAQVVELFWNGVAENVQVMGSFDGWSQGEHMSPEYNGSYATFSTTLMLRPGRYEIKFLVDGDWKLSPEFPTVGEGMLQNNLLIVE